MKDFLKKNRTLITIIIMIEICLLPTEIFLFYKQREFIDLGLLLTSILFVIFTVPIYNLVRKYNKEKEIKE